MARHFPDPLPPNLESGRSVKNSTGSTVTSKSLRQPSSMDLTIRRVHSAWLGGDMRLADFLDALLQKRPDQYGGTGNDRSNDQTAEPNMPCGSSPTNPAESRR